jgi:hypothetical protein
VSYQKIVQDADLFEHLHTLMILSILAKLYAGVSTSFLQEEPDFVKHAK